MAAQRPAPLPHLGLILGGEVLVAQQGAYGLTGQSATLDYSGASDPDSPAPLPSLGLLAGLGGNPQILVAESGTYSVSGQDVSFSRGYVVAANFGGYLHSGQAAALSPSLARSGDPAPLPHIGLLLAPGAGGYTLTADPGSYSITGSEAIIDYEVSAAQGAYSVTGQDAGLLYGRIMPADSGTYLVSGQDATFAIGGTDRTMAAEQGTYNLSGQDAATLRQYPLTAEHGFYALLGQQALLTFSSAATYILNVEGGSYSVSGQNAEFGKALIAETGYYTITGSPLPDVISGNSGGWPMPPRRKKKKEEPSQVEAEQARELAETQEKQELLRKQEERSKEVTRQIKELLDKQDAIREQILLENEKEEDEILMLIALSR